MKRKNFAYPKEIFLMLVAILCFGSMIVLINKEKVEPNEEVILEENNGPRNYYDFSKLTGEEILHYEDDLYTSLWGIDISTHQGIVDFEKVKEAGVQFIFIRLGYRGGIEGTLNLDNKFERNITEAKKYGFKIGIYFFSQALNEEEAIEEAEYVLKVLDGRKLDFPIVYDYEEVYYPDGELCRIVDLDQSQKTKNAKAFLERIDESEYDSMLYANPDWLKNHYIYDELLEYKLWLAQYRHEPTIDWPFNIWQYSNQGVIEGIDELVDLDLMFIRKSVQPS